MIPTTPFAKIVLAAATLLCAWALYQLFTPPAQPHSDAGVVTVDKTPRPIKAPVSMATNRPGETPVPSAVPTASDVQAPGPSVVPGGSLIAGSVLNQQGERLAGIEIVAAPRRVFTTEDEQQAAEQRTTSDTGGEYRFAGLAPGEYRLRSEETALYPGVSIHVRAGADAANLVLAPRQELWIYGVVKTGTTPLASVRIQPGRDTLNTTYSDTDGRFGLYLTLGGGTHSQDSLRFSLEGYSDARVVLHSDDPYATELALAGVQLSPIEGLAVVRGNVLADHAPIVQARVFLRATDHNHHYDTTTDAGGYFVLPDVVIGEYSLTVVPGGQYQDYSEDGLQVGAAGRVLRIALEPLETARLRGQMVDIQGKPVSGISLWLTGLSARARGARQVSGDARGFFAVEHIPAGELRFATHSDPRLRVTGATLTGPDDPPLQLTLDVGDHILEGQIVDAYSNSVPGAQISLIWSHENGGIASHSVRNITTDTSGYFRFSQLGPGAHTLNVSAAGYQRRRIEQDVGGEGKVRIELEMLSRAW